MEENMLCQYVYELTLNGRGSVKVKPDIAIINIGIITEDKELQKAVQNNAAITYSVISILKDAGIKESDISTLFYSVIPEYDYIEGRQIFRAFRVVNTLKVTIKDINKVGKIIDASVQNGANEIGSVDFTVSNPSAYYNQALNLAIKDSIGKAFNIEKTFGFNVNKTPIKITEETATFTPKLEMTMMRAEVTTPIQPGELEIAASIKAIFAYKASSRK